MTENTNIEKLLEIYRNGNRYQKEAAMEAIIVEHDKLIIHVINKYFSSYKHSYMDDMRQEGRQTLFEHVDKYDASRGAFSTFITPYIVEAIKNYICSIHGVSAHYAGQMKRYRKAVDTLNQRGIEHPSLGAIAAEMNIGLDAVQRVHEISCHINTISIEEDGKERELTEYDSTPDAIYEQAEFRKTIANAIAELPREERAVIRETFFSDSGNNELSLMAVASNLGMDVNTVRRLKNLGLRRLQRALSPDGYTLTSERRELEDFADSLQVSFILPEDAVEMNVEISLGFGDEVNF